MHMVDIFSPRKQSAPEQNYIPLLLLYVVTRLKAKECQECLLCRPIITLPHPVKLTGGTRLAPELGSTVVAADDMA